MVPDAQPPTPTPDPEAAAPPASVEPGGAAEAATPRSASPAAVRARARDAAIAGSILRLVAERGPARSICPSEAAREVASAEGLAEWHGLMGNVRRIAGRLQAEGRLEILRKGRPAPPDVRGVIRLRQPATAVAPAPRPGPGPHDVATAPIEPAVVE